MKSMLLWFFYFYTVHLEDIKGVNEDEKSNETYCNDCNGFRVHCL